MPLYEYRCSACQEVTEVRHGFGEGFPGVCPSCGAAEMARVFSPTGIVFKGSGFYINDSRKSSPAQAAEKPAASTEKAADGAPAEKPAAEKPAAAAPATPAAAPAATPAATRPKQSESSAA